MLARLCLVLLVLAGPVVGQAYDVVLKDGSGNPIPIAVLTVAPDGSYSLVQQEGAFTDHFLSMRPFECLEGPQKHWCHVPYPYENRRNISEDFVDLEYDFLFIWKGATDYGIDSWNGVYYRLEQNGDHLVGTLHEIDMGLLAVPPETGDLRPISHDDLHEAEPDSHWLPMLVVEPRN
ncbi:MAG: hypothetical protein AAGG56_14610 [Pseudomonadota bacterium]